MKKIIFVIALMFSSVMATEINWAKSYKDAEAKAKVEKKPIIIVFTTETCRWCRKLESTTLKDEDVVKMMNEKFIALHLDRDNDDYPAGLEVRGVPMTYFLNDNADAILGARSGYVEGNRYVTWMKLAIQQAELYKKSIQNKEK
ncbi:MAG: DUF255 domain-containing protein [Helicobacteraceae bacterium]|nr:DUF255 domain-containing protein [Helicobacteraceae bacterium]